MRPHVDTQALERQIELDEELQKQMMDSKAAIETPAVPRPMIFISWR